MTADSDGYAIDLERIASALFQQAPAAERRAYGAVLIGLAAMCRLSETRWDGLIEAARVDFRTDVVAHWVSETASEIEQENTGLQGVLAELTAALRPAQVTSLVGRLEGATAAIQAASGGAFVDWISATIEASAALTKGPSLTPAPLADLMVALACEGPPAPVFDPYCRSGELLDRAARKMLAHDARLPCVGIAAYSLDAALARLRLFFLGVDADIRLGDALHERLTVGERLRQFERVVCDPPWGRRGSLDIGLGASWLMLGQDGRGVTSEIAYLRLAQVMLARDGRAVVRVPLGVLFRGGSDRALRQALLAEDLVSMVIGLPAGLVPGTAIQSALVVLDRGARGRPSRRVILADLSAMRPDTDAWAARALTTLREIAYGTRPDGRGVEHDEIDANDFDLTPRRYLHLETEADAPLADLGVLDEARALEAEAERLARAFDEQLAAWRERGR